MKKSRSEKSLQKLSEKNARKILRWKKNEKKIGLEKNGDFQFSENSGIKTHAPHWMM